MLKKVLIMLMAAVMLVGCVACGEEEPTFVGDPTPMPTKVPTGDNLADNLFFHVDFSSESYEDVEGKAKATLTKDAEGGDVTYVEDEDEGKVANFQKACVNYDIDLNNIGKSFTMEAYVKCQKQGGLGVICGTYYHNDKAGVSFVAGMFDDVKGFGSLTGLSMVSGTLMSTRSVDAGFYRQWNHLVFVHDGENGKDHYYLNGVEVEGFEGGVSVSKAAMKHSKVDPGFKIGAYNTVPQFAVSDMNISYVKLYRYAAPAEDVTKMFENK